MHLKLVLFPKFNIIIVKIDDDNCAVYNNIIIIVIETLRMDMCHKINRAWLAQLCRS